MSQSLNSSIIYTQEFEVQQQHCDIQKHLNNVVYVQWIQDAAIAAYRAQGYSRETDEKNNTAWFVRRHEIDYLAPAFAEETIRLATWVECVSLSTFLRRTEFIRLEDNQLLCQAKTEWCYFNVKRNRPAKIPTDLKTSFLPDRV